MSPMHCAAAALVLAWLPLVGTQAASLGQVDTFEDGTTQGWITGLLGTPNPNPPVNVASGGPAGADDAFLRLTGNGGAGAGNRVVAINLGQWAGDYAAIGLTTLTMDLNNLGSTDLAIRLYLENPTVGPPTDTAVTDAFLLPVGSGWQRATFAVDPGALTGLTGDIDTLLANVTALRIFHGPLAAFPGPSSVGVLGVDNVAAVPLPAAGWLALAMAGAVLPFRRRRA